MSNADVPADLRSASDTLLNAMGDATPDDLWKAGHAIDNTEVDDPVNRIADAIWGLGKATVAIDKPARNETPKTLAHMLTRQMADGPGERYAKQLLQNTLDAAYGHLAARDTRKNVRLFAGVILIRTKEDWDLIQQCVKKCLIACGALPATSDPPRADEKADESREKFPKIPRNQDVLRLAKLIRKAKGSGRPKIDIAREIAEDNETKAQSLVRKLRDYPDLLK